MISEKKLVISFLTSDVSEGLTLTVHYGILYSLASDQIKLERLEKILLCKSPKKNFMEPFGLPNLKLGSPSYSFRSPEITTQHIQWCIDGVNTQSGFH